MGTTVKEIEVHFIFIVSKIILSLGFVFFHQEVASGSFCFLINCPWLLVFVLFEFLLFLFGFNLYCWTGTHFSWSFFIIFLFLVFGLIILFHFWFRYLLRELIKKYEILLMVIFLAFFYFLLLRLFYFFPSFGYLFIHYHLQVREFVLEKVSMFQIRVN